MKTYLNEIIPRLARHSERLDDITMLINKRWVLFDEVENQKTVYFFKKNYDLIISINGNVERGNWELIDNEHLSIKTNEGEFMFKKDFHDYNLFALKKDNVNEYAIFINEIFFDQKNFNTLESVNLYLSNDIINKESSLVIYPEESFETLKKDLIWGLFFLFIIIILVFSFVI